MAVVPIPVAEGLEEISNHDLSITVSELLQWGSSVLAGDQIPPLAGPEPWTTLYLLMDIVSTECC